MLHVLQAAEDKRVDEVVGQQKEAAAGHVQDSLGSRGTRIYSHTIVHSKTDFDIIHRMGIPTLSWQ